MSQMKQQRILKFPRGQNASPSSDTTPAPKPLFQDFLNVCRHQFYIPGNSTRMRNYIFQSRVLGTIHEVITCVPTTK